MKRGIAFAESLAKNVRISSTSRQDIIVRNLATSRSQAPLSEFGQKKELVKDRDGLILFGTKKAARCRSLHRAESQEESNVTQPLFPKAVLFGVTLLIPQMRDPLLPVARTPNITDRTAKRCPAPRRPSLSFCL